MEFIGLERLTQTDVCPSERVICMPSCLDIHDPIDWSTESADPVTNVWSAISVGPKMRFWIEAGGRSSGFASSSESALATMSRCTPSSSATRLRVSTSSSASS